MLELEALDHVQITAPPDKADATITFYASVLRLQRIEKPNARPGAWFELGSTQLHVGVEEGAVDDNVRSSGTRASGCAMLQLQSLPSASKGSRSFRTWTGRLRGSGSTSAIRPATGSKSAKETTDVELTIGYY